ncbi:MAG: hypothetical protein M1818_003093 [Claussenomyces sp. TS43310]|nr:MAG: hypothetical protein M1818_003093 [Claussenomyces sp. TS43310]
MAPGGPPGGGSRGRGGKFKKFTRGGGKHFSRNLRPLDADGNEVGMWGDGDAKGDEEEEEEDSEEESSSDEGAAEKPAMTREERRAAAKAKKEAAIARKKQQATQPGDMPSSSEESDEESDEEDMPANPNHSKAARSQASAAPVSVDEAADGVKNLSVKGAKGKAAPELSRREREAIQAQQAKERYQKLHAEGKTDEAKADLARLKLIREKREAEAARKQAEKEEREEAEKAKKTELDAREAKRREAALGPAKGKGKSKK